MIQLMLRQICDIENWVVEDDPSILTTEEAESFH
jgi:hypothetical protein